MDAMKRWQFWLGVAISLALLFWALQGLGLEELSAAFWDAHYIWLLPGVAVYFIGVWARAWRWHYLLRPVKAISTKAMFPVVAMGYFGNNVLPARAGEVLRAVVLKKREGVAISASLATIIVERIFDGVVMLAFVFLNLPELTRLTADSGFIGDIRTLALVGSVAFLGALGAFLVAAMFPQRAKALSVTLIHRLLPARYAERLSGLAERFLDGLEALRSPADAWMVFLTSVVIWLLETGKYWFVMHAFPFEVSYFALMLMNGIVNLATTIPSAPGYVGTFDAPGIAVLEAYGVSKAVAAAYTLVLHVALWVPITLLGFFFILREGIQWSEELGKVRQGA